MQRAVSLSATTAAHLGRMVLDDLAPGDRLPPERSIAEDLGVSRATVREALQELERRRLVSRTPGRGTVVLPRPAQAEAVVHQLGGAVGGAEDVETEDVAEFRALVEPQVAGLAARRACGSDLVELERILAATHAGLSAEESLERDVDFHVHLARASGNPLLVSLCEVSSGWVRAVRARSHASSAGRRSSYEWHRRILDAVRAGDEAAARTAMADHLADVAHLTDAAPSTPEPTDPSTPEPTDLEDHP